MSDTKFEPPAIYADGWWAAWSGYYDWCAGLGLAVPYTQAAEATLRVVREFSEACHWIWAYKGLAIVSAKPDVKWTDDRWDPEPPVIHNASGPAVRYADGFEIYAWRGTVVPKEWILDPDSIPPETPLTHTNMEQRRCAAEIIGWDKVLGGLNPAVIDEDDPEIGTLVEVTLPDAGRTRFLRVKCGTGRAFALCVPNEMKTALQANAWTYGLEPSDFAPEIRT